MSGKSDIRPSADPAYCIDSEEQLRSLYGQTHALALKKCLSSLDPYCREYIARSPFLCLSTQHADGTADVSPRGDPAGFVQVLDENTLAIPDRPGNNRLDSLSNILSNPSVGLLFLVPGFEDTLRVNGHATLNRDPALLSSMSMRNRTPTLAIIVQVHEAFLHCAKAFRRSRLWDPSQQQDRRQLPSLPAMVNEQTSGEPVPDEAAASMERALEEDYRKTLY